MGQTICRGRGLGSVFWSTIVKIKPYMNSLNLRQVEDFIIPETFACTLITVVTHKGDGIFLMLLEQLDRLIIYHHLTTFKISQVNERTIGIGLDMALVKVT
jgi:hypothetical protein